MIKGTILGGSPSSLWLKILDSFVMWCFEYPLGLMRTELDLSAHSTVDRWVAYYEERAAAYVEENNLMNFPLVHQRLQNTVCKKRPA